MSKTPSSSNNKNESAKATGQSRKPTVPSLGSLVAAGEENNRKIEEALTEQPATPVPLGTDWMISQEKFLEAMDRNPNIAYYAIFSQLMTLNQKISALTQKMETMSLPTLPHSVHSGRGNPDYLRDSGKPEVVWSQPLSTTSVPVNNLPASTPLSAPPKTTMNWDDMF